MNNREEILKIKGYDEFKCTAEKCRFTCCAGWDIGIDDDTYVKLKQDENNTDYILNKVESKSCGKGEAYFINKETRESCPFLDEKGLCQIIKSHGEDYLSLTCKNFPGVANIFGGKKELSLTCSCPEVVEIISNVQGKVRIGEKFNEGVDKDLLEVKLRDGLVNIVEQEELSLDNKLIVGYQLLMELLKYKNFGNGALLNSIEKYNVRETVEEVIKDCDELELDLDGSIEEINYLFIDIIENYKEVEGLKELLGGISDFAEEANLEELAENWNEFKTKFKSFDELLEKCIVSKILSNCVDIDLRKMITTFELIILEYLLVRYAVFMKGAMSEDKEVNLQDVKDYVVAFSRVIGNNTEAVVEFIKDGFGDSILEIGYLCFITLF
ncbi:MAG: flagellin lysine-N-methylase [Clostridium sp.]